MKKSIGSLTEAAKQMEHLASLAQRSAALQAQAASLSAELVTINAEISASTEQLQQFFGPAPAPATKEANRASRVPKKATRAPAVSLASAPNNIVALKPSGFQVRSDPRLPPTVAERVLVIMRDLARPVLPKQIATEYLLREWPMPKKGTIYNLISGTVAYLYQRKGVLVRTENGYVLPHGDIQAMLNAPIKGYVKAADRRKAEAAAAASVPEHPGFPNLAERASG